MKTINELIKLTDIQESLVNEMYQLYCKAQSMSICFAINDNSNLVAYNGLDIADCDTERFNEEDYEAVDLEQMREIFPVWDYDTLCLLREENNETMIEL